jgi:hypothetical protein
VDLERLRGNRSLKLFIAATTLRTRGAGRAISVAPLLRPGFGSAPP